MSSIILIDNQPVSFKKLTDPCSMPEQDKYVQLVNPGDKTQFQIKLKPCDGAVNYITNGTFGSDTGWTNSDAAPLDGGWGISDDKLCRSNSVGISSAWGSTSAPNAPGIFQVTISVLSCSGSFTVGIGLMIIGTISAPGIYTFTGYDPSSTSKKIVITNVNSQDTICIDAVSIYKIANPKVSLYGADCGWVKTWDPANSLIVCDPEIEGYCNFQFAENSLTFFMDWVNESIAAGCYHFCLVDGCTDTNGQNSSQLLIDGGFPGSWSGSSIGGSTTLGLGSGSADFFTSDDNGAAAIINTATELIAGVCYEVTFTILSDSDPVSPLNASVKIKDTTFEGTPRTAAGTYTEVFTSDGSLFSLFFEATGPSGDHRMSVNNIIIVVADACLSCDHCSNTFKYAEHECTHLINVCNDNNGFGFVFNGSNFSPQIRLSSALVRPTYKSEREKYEDSAGEKKVTYFRRRKIKAFRTPISPKGEFPSEYVLDFLSTIMGYDHCFVDGVEMFVEDDEFSTTYDTRNDIATKIEINMSQKFQLVENTTCGTGTNNCNENNQIAQPGCGCS